MNERMIKLEEKLMLLERTVEELDEVVRDLFERVTAVRDELARHRADTRQQFDEMSREPEDDVPPHW